MTKAAQACSSANVLLELGDVDGAVNRAYYAMFDAARAALAVSGTGEFPDIVSRTHSQVIGDFGKHLVQSGLVSRDLGRLLNRAFEIRRVADYNGDSVQAGDARELVDKAKVFVAAMQAVVLAKENPQQSEQAQNTEVEKRMSRKRNQDLER